MKFSYNWIREMVEDLDYAPGPLERLITMKTAECEGVETVGILLAEAVPATVETIEPIAGGHNVKATVDAGRYGRKIVVCGAPNCRAGVRTVYVPLGVKLISGVESDGMLASAAPSVVTVSMHSPDRAHGTGRFAATWLMSSFLMEQQHPFSTRSAENCQEELQVLLSCDRRDLPRAIDTVAR